MLSKLIRLALTASIFVWAIYQFFEGNIGNGISLIFLSAIVLLTYFRHERMIMALWFLRKNNMEKAEKHLDAIKTPEKTLTRGQQAYYYLLKGMMESQRGVGKAETLLKRSLNIGLRNKSDQALAKMNLAGIAMAKRRKREATILLTEAKKLDSKKLFNDQIRMLQNQMKRM